MGDEKIIELGFINLYANIFTAGLIDTAHLRDQGYLRSQHDVKLIIDGLSAVKTLGVSKASQYLRGLVKKDLEQWLENTPYKYELAAKALEIKNYVEHELRRSGVIIHGIDGETFRVGPCDKDAINDKVVDKYGIIPMYSKTINTGSPRSQKKPV